MAIIFSECPECGAEGKVDDSLVGRRIKCNKCGQSFTFEIGGSYDLAPPVRPPASAAQRPEGSSGPPARSKDAPKRPAADPELEKRLEQWAEE